MRLGLVLDINNGTLWSYKTVFNKPDRMMSSSPLSSAPSSPQRRSPSKRQNVKPSTGPPRKKMRAIVPKTPAMPRSTNPKEKITCFCGMTLRPAGLDIHLKTHPNHNSAHSASSSSEDEYPTAPTMTIPRQTTGGKSVPKPKANEVSNADASPASGRRIAPLPSRAQVLVPSPQPQAPAAPRARTKPAVRGPKVRMTRRQYHPNYAFGSSGDETVSTGSDTEYEGEHKDGRVEFDAGDSHNDVYMREHYGYEEERLERPSYQDTHPLEPVGYAADGSASEDSDDPDDEASSYSPSPLAQSAPLPAEPLEIVNILQSYHSLEPIDDWMYGPASEDSTDSDDDGSSSSSSSSSPSSPLAKPAPLPVEPVDPVEPAEPLEPVKAPQPDPEVADMDVDTDADSLFSGSDSDIYGD